jgi:hypothetical protein
MGLANAAVVWTGLGTWRVEVYTGMEKPSLVLDSSNAGWLWDDGVKAKDSDKLSCAKSLTALISIGVRNLAEGEKLSLHASDMKCRPQQIDFSLWAWQCAYSDWQHGHSPGCRDPQHGKTCSS